MCIYMQASQRAVIADMTKKNGSLHSSALALQQENKRLTERLRVLRASVADGGGTAGQDSDTAGGSVQQQEQQASQPAAGGSATRARAAARNPMLRPVRINHSCDCDSTPCLHVVHAWHASVNTDMCCVALPQL
jgi:hypothetical protein